MGEGNGGGLGGGGVSASVGGLRSRPRESVKGKRPRCGRGKKDRTGYAGEGGTPALAFSFCWCSVVRSNCTISNPLDAIELATLSLSSVGSACRISFRIASHPFEDPLRAGVKRSRMRMKAAALI